MNLMQIIKMKKGIILIAIIIVITTLTSALGIVENSNFYDNLGGGANPFPSPNGMLVTVTDPIKLQNVTIANNSFTVLGSDLYIYADCDGLGCLIGSLEGDGSTTRVYDLSGQDIYLFPNINYYVVIDPVSSSLHQYQDPEDIPYNSGYINWETGIMWNATSNSWEIPEGADIILNIISLGFELTDVIFYENFNNIPDITTSLPQAQSLYWNGSVSLYRFFPFYLDAVLEPFTNPNDGSPAVSLYIESAEDPVQAFNIRTIPVDFPEILLTPDTTFELDCSSSSNYLDGGATYLRIFTENSTGEDFRESNIPISQTTGCLDTIYCPYSVSPILDTISFSVQDLVNDQPNCWNMGDFIGRTLISAEIMTTGTLNGSLTENSIRFDNFYIFENQIGVTRFVEPFDNPDIDFTIYGSSAPNRLIGEFCYPLSSCDWSTDDNTYASWIEQGTNNNVFLDPAPNQFITSSWDTSYITLKNNFNYPAKSTYVDTGTLNIPFGGLFTFLIDVGILPMQDIDNPSNSHNYVNYLDIRLDNFEHIYIILYEYKNNHLTDLTPVGSCSYWDLIGNPQPTTEFVGQINLNQARLETCYGGSLDARTVTQFDFRSSSLSDQPIYDVTDHNFYLFNIYLSSDGQEGLYAPEKMLEFPHTVVWNIPESLQSTYLTYTNTTWNYGNNIYRLLTPPEDVVLGWDLIIDGEELGYHNLTITHLNTSTVVFFDEGNYGGLEDNIKITQQFDITSVPYGDYYIENYIENPVSDFTSHIIITILEDVEECTENWVLDTETCTISDLLYREYVDTNACGTTDDRPADHQNPTDLCNYCTIQYSYDETACVDNLKNVTYNLENGAECYDLTLLPDDCDIPEDLIDVECGYTPTHDSNLITGLVIDTGVEVGRTWIPFAGLIALIGLAGWVMFLI